MQLTFNHNLNGEPVEVIATYTMRPAEPDVGYFSPSVDDLEIEIYTDYGCQLFELTNNELSQLKSAAMELIYERNAI